MSIHEDVPANTNAQTPVPTVPDAVWIADRIVDRLASNERKTSEEDTMLNKLDLEQTHLAKMKELEQRPMLQKTHYRYALCALVLLMSGFGVAIAYGKDQIAMEAIKGVVTLGGLAFGAYYYGKAKGQKSKDDED